MTRARFLVPLVLFVASCTGDTSHPATGSSSTDETPELDAGVTSDATTCTATGSLKASSVTLENVPVGKQLILDGVGTRCEQLQRAILDPAQRPSEIAAFDASSGLQPPLCTEIGERTNVNIDVTGLLGQRLLSTGQYLRVWVDNATDTLDEIRLGWFIVPPLAAPTTCTPVASTQDAVVGHRQDYVAFQFCGSIGEGSWTLRSNDLRSHVGDGLYFDGTHVHVVREIDVEPHGSNITPLLRQSDLNCFGRIAIVLIVDVETGRVLDQRRHCVVC